MCVGGVSRGTNSLGRLLETIAGIVPAIDRLTGPVLEKGELFSSEDDKEEEEVQSPDNIGK